MRIIIANEILQSLSLEKTSENYQKVYKIQNLILKDADDFFVYEEAIKRGLATVPKCEICGRDLERSYSSNGVLDSELCPKVMFYGSDHPQSLIQKVKLFFDRRGR